MGYTSYNIGERSLRSEANNYVEVKASTAAFNAVFQQQDKGEMHKDMDPKGLKFRECRDSEAHPNTVPIIVGLDVTGSMGKIPKDFIVDGLPTMMSTIIQRGTPDASVCFMAIGDHEYDRAPIQVAQFESGDAELDMWLTRTWVEGHGGGNDGESYSLPWYVAARHTKIDSLEKRGKKGFLFTIGDEPCLQLIPANAIKAIFGEDEAIQGTINSEEILKEAQKSYNVFHLALNNRGEANWKKMLGQNYMSVPEGDYTKIPKMIAEIVNSYNSSVLTGTNSKPLVIDEDGPGGITL